MRIRMIVEVDTDPIPGQFHNPEVCVRTIERTLQDQLPGYNPVVRLHPSTVDAPSIHDFLANFFGPTVRIRGNGTPDNYIRAIKALKDAQPHLSLKEAKDAVDGYLAR